MFFQAAGAATTDCGDDVVGRSVGVRTTIGGGMGFQWGGSRTILFCLCFHLKSEAILFFKTWVIQFGEAHKLFWYFFFVLVDVLHRKWIQERNYFPFAVLSDFHL